MLSSQDPDIIAIQEVTRTSLPKLRAALRHAEYNNLIDSIEGDIDGPVLFGPRRYGQLIASKFPLARLAPDFAVPWPERVLSGVVETPNVAIEIHTTHVPPGSGNGWIKIETLEGIYRRLAQKAELPRILCGDFNTPQQEDPDGTVITWGQRVQPDGTAMMRRRCRGGPGERWDAGERCVLLGLAKHDLPDVFRQLYGYGVHDASWSHCRKGRVIERRFDHIFASRKLRAAECRYLHEFRESGLSDHSAVVAVFGTGDVGTTAFNRPQPRTSGQNGPMTGPSPATVVRRRTLRYLAMS